MSAAAPTIDETVVVDLDAMLAAQVPCVASTNGCERPATWHVRCVTPGCANTATLCAPHWERLRSLHPANTMLACPACGASGVFTALYAARTL
ncbi:hypothetical protein O1W71_02185 [Microbacterium sp. H37-C3]|uniref:hypothetical protein n=1 Tax=Microbacterium sp. H37-C3 TaxID=3004354 RepID=UPI0022AEE89F|nr:hypothetical protein [Microbacterium sp. H37-C3]MCZ4066477.1 hypothetical protein [Microbacterium sp. H37-C3]